MEEKEESFIKTPLDVCPFCRLGKLIILETIKKGTFLVCLGCNKQIYEIEIKKRFCMPFELQSAKDFWERLSKRQDELRLKSTNYKGLF